MKRSPLAKCRFLVLLWCLMPFFFPSWSWGETISARTSQTPLLYDMTLGQMSGSLVLDKLHSYYQRDFSISFLRVPIEGHVLFSYRVESRKARPVGLMLTMNGEMVGKRLLIPDGAKHSFIMNIPSVYFLPDNHLGVGLYYPGSNRCLMPKTTDIRVFINPPGLISYEYGVFPPDLKLSRLPFPILDRRDNPSGEIGFLFGRVPDESTLRAAGILAAWLGRSVRFQSVRYKVVIGNDIPDMSRLIVFSIQKKTGGGPFHPSVQLSSSDPDHFRLTFSGFDGNDLVDLVRSLIRGREHFPGNRMELSSQSESTGPPVSPPFSDPFWVRAGKKVHFRDLLDTSTLTQKGFPPGNLNVGFMLPPALFYWNSPGAKVHYQLVYDQPWQGARTFLRILVNGRQIGFKVLPGGKNGHYKNLVEKGDFLIPFYDLGRQNQIQFLIGSEIPINQICSVQAFGNSFYRLSSDSTINFSGTGNWTALPDLSQFLHWGYPFTKYADLSRTKIVLESFHSPAILSRFLNLMARWGQVTGALPENPEIREAGHPGPRNKRDLLFLGSFRSSARYRDLFPKAPMIWKGDTPVPVPDRFALLALEVLGGDKPRLVDSGAFPKDPDRMIGEYKNGPNSRSVVLVLSKNEKNPPVPFLSSLGESRPESLDLGKSWFWENTMGGVVTTKSMRVFIPMPDGHEKPLTLVRYFFYQFKVAFYLVAMLSVFFLSLYFDRYLRKAVSQRLGQTEEIGS